jgi:hypothetical protein
MGSDYRSFQGTWNRTDIIFFSVLFPFLSHTLLLEYWKGRRKGERGRRMGEFEGLGLGGRCAFAVLHCIGGLSAFLFRVAKKHEETSLDMRV